VIVVHVVLEMRVTICAREHRVVVGGVVALLTREVVVAPTRNGKLRVIERRA